jgi:hypothetical protein
LGGISGGAGYLNASAFRLPQSFELGNVPRLTAQLRTLGKPNLDSSLMKNFTFTEHLRPARRRGF